MTLRRKLRKFLDKYHGGYYLEKFIINDGQKHPVAVICPGGGYHWVCSFSEGMPYAQKLNRMGCSAVVVHYSCGEGKAYPAPHKDLARAIEELIARSDEWKLDINNYSLWGSSAGGHLAASFGTDSMGYKRYNLPKPAAIILSYPVISMYEKAHAGSRRYLLGENPSLQWLEMASVERQITADYPPTFCMARSGGQRRGPGQQQAAGRGVGRKGCSPSVSDLLGRRPRGWNRRRLAMRGVV